MARIPVANHDPCLMATCGRGLYDPRMSDWIGLALVAGIAALGWWLRSRVRELEGRVSDLRLGRRELERRLEEAEAGLQVTRAHLADVAAGDAPERPAIVSGKAWRDVQPAPALVLWQQTPDLFVLDVRTEAEWANGHIPRAHLVPVDELEDRLRELPPKDARILVHCAAGGRSLQACQILADKGYTRLLNLVGGMHAWPGPREQGATTPTPPPSPNLPAGTTINHRGGPISGEAVVGAIRQCFDPEIPLNVYDLGLVYDIDIAPDAIAVKMTLTSEGCPSARTIPLDVKQRIVALGQENVRVDVVFDPPWHPSRISDEGKQKLGLG
jgi:metal-sulfur cluster biosynthetic enzyme/rhodanese-related sulfurtransferase